MSEEQFQDVEARKASDDAAEIVACKREWCDRVEAAINAGGDPLGGIFSVESAAGIQLVKELAAARAGTHKVVKEAAESAERAKVQFEAQVAELRKELAAMTADRDLWAGDSDEDGDLGTLASLRAQKEDAEKSFELMKQTADSLMSEREALAAQKEALEKELERIKEVTARIQSSRAQSGAKARDAYDRGAGIDSEAFEDGKAEAYGYALHLLGNIFTGGTP